MAKELPYFRFTVQDWQNGKISLESFEMQGLFISVCGYYWINDCSLTLAILQKKFSNATTLLKQLIELGIIKHENRHDKVEIEFLNIQYDLLSEKRKARQDAGSKGGKAKANVKQKSSYKDKDKDNNKDKDKDKLDFYEFWNLYPNKVGKVKCEPKWNKLNLEQQTKILSTLPTFIKNKPFESYTHPNPETYFNQERWNDEIVINPNANKKHYYLQSPHASWDGFLTDDEFKAKTQTNYWNLIKIE